MPGFPERQCTTMTTLKLGTPGRTRGWGWRQDIPGEGMAGGTCLCPPGLGQGCRKGCESQATWGGNREPLPGARASRTGSLMRDGVTPSAEKQAHPRVPRGTWVRESRGNMSPWPHLLRRKVEARDLQRTR